MIVLTVVGARPQFIKTAMVSRALRARGIREVLVHTGQHYDDNMSRVFFDEMGIPKPDHNLGVGSGGHAFQTGEAMKGLESLCAEHQPDVLLVHGDTNATLAGALVAAKQCIPGAHVEAGLRSFDRAMPEEVNRVVTDHVSKCLFCPTDTAVENLRREGITRHVHQVGDVMYDAALHFAEQAKESSDVLSRLGVSEKSFVLVTVHRDFNTDSKERLEGIIRGVLQSGVQVVFPAHPRVRKCLEQYGLLGELEESGDDVLTEPVGYLDMIRLELGARAVMTDSGGVQKEAYFYGVPCLTVRPSTEWVETVDAGWNHLLAADADQIAGALDKVTTPGGDPPEVFGDGHAAERIAEAICAR